jgi:hypothetical protein
MSAVTAIPPHVRELADAVVSKPFELDTLLAVIRRVDAEKLQLKERAVG